MQPTLERSVIPRTGLSRRRWTWAAAWLAWGMTALTSTIDLAQHGSRLEAAGQGRMASPLVAAASSPSLLALSASFGIALLLLGVAYQEGGPRWFIRMARGPRPASDLVRMQDVITAVDAPRAARLAGRARAWAVYWIMGGMWGIVTLVDLGLTFKTALDADDGYIHAFDVALFAWPSLLGLLVWWPIVGAQIGILHKEGRLGWTLRALRGP